MSRNSLLPGPVIVVLAAAAALAGCADADYLNHRDTVALAAGDSVRGNVAMETTDPWYRASNSTAGLGTDAGRATDYLRSRSGGSSTQPVTVNIATGGSAIGK